MQVDYDDTTLALCGRAALNAWDKVKETGKRSELLTDILQGSGEAFTDFFEDWLQL